MSVLNLLSNNYEPVSSGASEEAPTTFSDVVSAGFADRVDNRNAVSSSKLIAELQEERGGLYRQIEGKSLMGSNYSEANSFLSLGATQDGEFSPLFETGVLDFLRPDAWGWAQRLHKDDTYINLHVKELKQKDPEKYKNLLTNEEIREAAKNKAGLSTAEFQNVASRADEDAAFWGGIVGELGGALTDPINILTLPIGAAASSGIMRTIAVEAGIQSGVEAVSQPVIYNWQKEVGNEYDLGDVANNIMGAAVLGGAFAGVVKGAVPTAQATFALMQKSSTFNSLQKQASGYMSRVAHFREANPNPAVVSELHTDTVAAVNAVVRKGENPSTANLPMTSKQFDEIGVDDIGLTVQQKSVLDKVQDYRINHINMLDKVSVARELGDSAVKGEDGNPITVFHGTKKKFDRFEKQPKGRQIYGEGFYFTTSKKEASEFTNKTVDGDARVIETYLNIKNPYEFRVGTDPMFGRPKQELIDEGFDGVVVRRTDKPDFYIAFDDKQIFQIEKDIFDTPASIDDVPATLEPIPKPITNDEMNDVLTRLESIDNEKVTNENFRQLLETNADSVITLEDGTSKTLRQLQDEFAEDEKFIQEISTCAIG